MVSRILQYFPLNQLHQRGFAPNAGHATWTVKAHIDDEFRPALIVLVVLFFSWGEMAPIWTEKNVGEQFYSGENHPFTHLGIKVMWSSHARFDQQKLWESETWDISTTTIHG